MVRAFVPKSGGPWFKSHLGRKTLFLIFQSFVLLGPAWAKDLRYDRLKKFFKVKLRTKIQTLQIHSTVDSACIDVVGGWEKRSLQTNIIISGEKRKQKDKADNRVSPCRSYFAGYFPLLWAIWRANEGPSQRGW